MIKEILGKIDWVQIYDTVLTPEEITNITEEILGAEVVI